MNIAVIGLGSMGKRRIGLLKNNHKDIVIYGVDSNQDRREQVSDLYGIKTYSSLENVFKTEKVDTAMICTPPITHSDIIMKMIDYKLNVFSEINLVSDKYEDIIQNAKDNNCKLFLSSTPLYRKEMEYITNSTKKQNKKLNYIYHVGQYLPDWHPWESYKDFFVGNKKTNGCREIFAIELPWLIDAFGDVCKISAVKSKNTDLEIDYNDNYIVTLEHSTGHKGSLIVDVVSRKPVRILEVYGEELYISWNGTPTSLNCYDFINKSETNINLYEEINKDDNYAQFVLENAYLDEINDFIDFINEKSLPKYSFEKDREVLKLIDMIES